jgi:hypothetical protein
MRTERDIDEAIDRAVRDIMGAEPRAGLRARVLGRLTRPERPWFTFPQLAAAAALIAIVIVGTTVLLRNRDGAVPYPSHTAKQQPAPIHLPAPLPQVAETDPPRATSVPRPIQRRAVFPPRGSVAAASLPPDAAPPIAAAPAETPGDPEPSAPSLKPIVIAPVTIAPIVVAPIRPPR